MQAKLYSGVLFLFPDNAVNCEEASVTPYLSVIGGYFESSAPLGNGEYYLFVPDSIFKELAIKEKGQMK